MEKKRKKNFLSKTEKNLPQKKVLKSKKKNNPYIVTHWPASLNWSCNWAKIKIFPNVSCKMEKQLVITN